MRTSASTTSSAMEMSRSQRTPSCILIDAGDARDLLGVSAWSVPPKCGSAIGGSACSLRGARERRRRRERQVEIGLLDQRRPRISAVPIEKQHGRLLINVSCHRGRGRGRARRILDAFIRDSDALLVLDVAVISIGDVRPGGGLDLVICCAGLGGTFKSICVGPWSVPALGRLRRRGPDPLMALAHTLAQMKDRSGRQGPGLHQRRGCRCRTKSARLARGRRSVEKEYTAIAPCTGSSSPDSACPRSSSPSPDGWPGTASASTSSAGAAPSTSRPGPESPS